MAKHEKVTVLLGGNQSDCVVLAGEASLGRPNYRPILVDTPDPELFHQLSVGEDTSVYTGEDQCVARCQ